MTLVVKLASSAVEGYNMQSQRPAVTKPFTWLDKLLQECLDMFDTLRGMALQYTTL